MARVSFRKAGVIAQQTRAQMMPPHLITHDGTCGDYRAEETLSDEQIATLTAWTDSARLEGMPQSLQRPPVAGLGGGTEYQTPQISPVAQGGHLAEFDEYRCYAFDPKLTANGFITGYQVSPGNQAMVHHLLGLVVDPTHVTASGKTNAELMQALDSQDEGRPGWPCFGLAGDGVEVSGIPVSWGPGQVAVEYPEGIGFEVKPTDKIVVQMHYNLADSRVQGQSDSTQLKVRYAPQAQRRAVFLFWDRCSTRFRAQTQSCFLPTLLPRS